MSTVYPLVFAIVLAAAGSLAPTSTLFSDGSPPLRFQGSATVPVEFRDQDAIATTCQALFGAPPAGRTTNACYTGHSIIMPNPCSFPETDLYAHMLCHELGHVNGWPPTHGD